MKAYIVGLTSNPDVGNSIVFAKNSKEAKKIAEKTDIADDKESYIDLTVHRYPLMDNKESLSEREYYCILWREGWWFDQPNCPAVETDTSDDVFYKWYDKTFKK